MNNLGRNIIIWLVFGAALLALFNLFQSPSSTSPGSQLAYSDFIAEVEGQQVVEVVIDGRNLKGTAKNGRVITSVMPEGTAMTTRGRAIVRRLWALRMKWRSMASVTSKSAMTPSLSGRMATILPGVRPSIRLASSPTARTSLVPAFTATTDGSRSTIPWSFTLTKVFAVPRSIPMSFEKNPNSLPIMLV